MNYIMDVAGDQNDDCSAISFGGKIHSDFIQLVLEGCMK